MKFFSFLLSIVVVSGNRRPENVTNPDIIGYYSPSWDRGSRGPPGATMGVAFSGWVDPSKAIADYHGPALKGEKYCSVGGGNDHGRFTVDRIQKITAECNLFIKAGYQGICYDVEEVTGSGSALAQAFSESFAKCKAAGLKIFVTTSHTAPYKSDSPQDAVTLVRSWVSDPNIDILSPQLYSSGDERSPDFAETNNCKSQGCTWALWKGARAAIAPSLANGNQWSQAQSGMSQRGINIVGWVQWQEV